MKFWKFSIVNRSKVRFYNFAYFFRFIFRTYNDKGRCKPFGKFHKSKGELDNPLKLYFDIDEKLESHIDDALSRAKKVSI